MRMRHWLGVVAIATGVAVAQDAVKAPEAPPPSVNAEKPKEAEKPPEPAPPPPEEAKPIDTVPAQNAALAWLGIVDAGGYGRSWDASASLMKNAITREKWEVAVSLARGPLGAVVSRKVRAVRYLTSIPNGPDGEYVVMEFEAIFGERRYVETLTVMREADMSWRVAGYYVR